MSQQVLPLHSVVLTGDETSVADILKSNSSGFVNKADMDGLTPLHLAAWRGRLDICKVLINHGADTNALDNQLASPLHYAAQSGHSLVVELLHGGGSNIHANTAAGATPLHLATEVGSLATVETLLQASASPYSPLDVKPCTSKLAFTLKLEKMFTDKIETPLLIAVERNDTACILLLLKYSGRDSEDIKTLLVDKALALAIDTETSQKSSTDCIDPSCYASYASGMITEKHVKKLQESGLVVIDNFLKPAQVEAVRCHLIGLQREGVMRPTLQQLTRVREDTVVWLSEDEVGVGDTTPPPPPPPPRVNPKEGLRQEDEEDEDKEGGGQGQRLDDRCKKRTKMEPVITSAASEEHNQDQDQDQQDEDAEDTEECMCQGKSMVEGNHNKNNNKRRMTTHAVLCRVKAVAHELNQLPGMLPLLRGCRRLTVPRSLQATCFKGGGGGYLAHRDSEEGEDRAGTWRQVTVIVYVNPVDWEADQDGGCLRCFQSGGTPGGVDGVDGGEAAMLSPWVDIAPLGGRLVMFWSSKLLHEVMPSHRDRFALTLWCVGQGVAFQGIDGPD